MKDYAVIYAWTGRNYSAHSPDVPGCIATGKTLEEVEHRFQEALVFHLEGLREDGLPIPEPTTHVGHVAIAA